MPTVRAEAGIEASRTHIWRVLADFGGIERRSPVVLRSDSTSEAKEGVGAARHCELAPRGTVEEQVVEWEPERHLGINVDPAGPIAAQRSDFDVTEAGPGVRVSMAITFELHPEAVDRGGPIEAALLSAAQGSVAGLKYHAENG